MTNKTRTDLTDVARAFDGLPWRDMDRFAAKLLDWIHGCPEDQDFDPRYLAERLSDFSRSKIARCEGLVKITQAPAEPAEPPH